MGKVGQTPGAGRPPGPGANGLPRQRWTGRLPAGARGRQRRRRALWCWLFLLPQTVVFGLFVLWPTLASWYFAFFNWDGIGWPTDYVGFDNFHEVAGDSTFWNAFGHSLIYTVALVVLVVPTALLVAIVLNNPRLQGRNVLRAMFVLPVVLTAAVVGLEMRQIFSTDHGLVNGVLQGLHIIDKPIDFLNQAGTAMLVLILVGSWKTFGVKVVYWLAGLQTLPQDVYDAAKVDGAGRWQQFRYVTMPMLVPFLVVICFLQTMNGLRVFDVAKTLTDGGPYFATDMVPLYIYRYAFEPAAAGGMFSLPRLGFASAAGIFYGLVTFAISALLGGLVHRYGRMRDR